jgi:NTP pyrophosphatase (non-canonical NTP hydrolase)
MRTRSDTSDMGERERLTLGALGLSGEAGEVTDHIKKIAFQGHDIDREALGKEIGDVMWYVAYLLDTLDIALDDVLATNISKLQARYPLGFSEARSRNRSDTGE